MKEYQVGNEYTLSLDVWELTLYGDDQWLAQGEDVNGELQEVWMPTVVADRITVGQVNELRATYAEAVVDHWRCDTDYHRWSCAGATMPTVDEMYGA